MKTVVRNAVAVALGAAAASTGWAGDRSNPELLVVGPIESVDAAHGIATILGQRVHTAALDRLAIGDSAAIFGTERADGSIVASVVQTRGLYVPGASSVFLLGTVQAAQPSVGRIVVNGVTVDLTAAMSSGNLSPAVGSKLALSGTQPVSGGHVLVSGIVGSGISGIVGSGTAGIVGSGTAGIVGSGTKGIVGSGSKGIVGSGAKGIVGSGAKGIVGSG
jgi:hypothetical protein